MADVESCLLEQRGPDGLRVQLDGPEKIIITLKPRHLSPSATDEVEEGEEEEDDEPEVSPWSRLRLSGRRELKPGLLFV